MNTKRKIVIGVATLAAVSLVGAGSYAYFVDSEVSANQSIAAGTLDLTIDNQTPDLAVANAAPGDSGQVSWALANGGTLPGNLSLQVVITEDLDNGCNEPEDAVDGPNAADCGANGGELDDALLVTITDDHSFTPVWGPGTLRQLHDQTAGATPAARRPYFMLGAADTRQLIVSYSIPTSVENVIQSDSVKFHIDLKLDQQVPPGPPAA
jgi:predicted ribosomally synthesized peptide with SipW-like signal peptide